MCLFLSNCNFFRTIFHLVRFHEIDPFFFLFFSFLFFFFFFVAERLSNSPSVYMLKIGERFPFPCISGRSGHWCQAHKPNCILNKFKLKLHLEQFWLSGFFMRFEFTRISQVWVFFTMFLSSKCSSRREDVFYRGI